MSDSLSLSLVDKGLIADQTVLTVGYDKGDALRIRILGVSIREVWNMTTMAGLY